MPLIRCKFEAVIRRYVELLVVNAVLPTIYCKDWIVAFIGHMISFVVVSIYLFKYSRQQGCKIFF